MTDVVMGVIDEPIDSKERDALDIQKHSDALIKFIRQSATPLTIGIQGEWGSGKTSLLNAIKQELSSDPHIKQIWINSWENSLLATPEESLIKIINEIIGELLTSDGDKERKDKIMSAAGTVFKGALRIGANMTLGSIGEGIANELMAGADKNGIKELRNNLIDLVSEIRDRPSNPFKKIVIYVDDLDRVEPKDAVKILELLKNIFSVPSCVFVLAIDYQVVVKGLEHKFGKQTAANEWEFRAFFDKIIQLPFMMPMGQYNIAKYVTSLLDNVGFAKGAHLSPDVITDVIKHTIGGNPRSLKRLVNSVALIEIFAADSVDPNLDALLDKTKQAELMFALVCIQIAYPDVYNLMADYPRIEAWDDDLAYEMTQSKELEEEQFQRDFEIAKKTDDFDEDWEQCVYKICYVKPRYRVKAIDVSRVIGIVKDRIIGVQGEKSELAIDAVMNQTAVTNVTSTDQPKKTRDVWKTEEEKTEANELWNLLLDRLDGKCEVYSKGRRTGSSGVIRVKHKEFPDVTFWMSHLGGLLGIRIDGPSIERNVAIFDHLQSMKDQIESAVKLPLVWKRNTTAKRQSISVEDPFGKEFSAKYAPGDETVPAREGWDAYLNWMEEKTPNLERAFLKGLASMDLNSLPQ